MESQRLRSFLPLSGYLSQWGNVTLKIALQSVQNGEIHIFIHSGTLLTLEKSSACTTDKVQQIGGRWPYYVRMEEGRGKKDNFGPEGAGDEGRGGKGTRRENTFSLDLTSFLYTLGYPEGGGGSLFSLEVLQPPSVLRISILLQLSSNRRPGPQTDALSLHYMDKQQKKHPNPKAWMAKASGGGGGGRLIIGTRVEFCSSPPPHFPSCASSLEDPGGSSWGYFNYLLTRTY